MRRLLAVFAVLPLLCGAWEWNGAAVTVWNGASVSTWNGTTVGGASCTSGTVVAESWDGESAASISGNTSAGQSFQVTSSGTLHSVDLEAYSITTPGTYKVRVGSSTNMSSSYLAESDAISISATGTISFTFSTHPSLSTGTTYYLSVAAPGSGDVSFTRNASGTYSNGSYYYGTSSIFNVSDNLSTFDLKFRVKKCSD